MGYPIPPFSYIGDVITATVAGDQDNCYEANVIYEGDPQILAGDSVFKMWYSSGWAAPNLNYAESLDGITWTKLETNPIVAAHYRSMVLKVGATYYLYASAAGQGQVNLYTSADGVTWALDTAGVLAAGSAGAWDDGSVANMHVWYEGAGDWRMLYEAKRALTGWSIGYATSADGRAWTKHASNPVITGTGGRGGPWLKKSGSTYYLWAHMSLSAATDPLPTDIYRWSSSDLITWTMIHPWPMIYRRAAEEGARTAVGQCADVFICEANGIAYVYYSGSADGSQQSGAQRVRLATCPASYITAGY